ncbi:MAG: hypothetical protein H6810_06490 [Phycisphaeraceae bacterium]|nr:MAG: hypothetical protein H6810_06490 [Phycisphaeraceae bacterium]
MKHVFPIGLIGVGAICFGASAGCVSVSISNCCDALGLNFTRACGFFHDQDCPDEVISNPAYYKATAVLNGKHPGTPGESVLCTYKTGSCNGSWGNNLCEMSGEKTHECVNQPGGEDGCTTAQPVPE